MTGPAPIESDRRFVFAMDRASLWQRLQSVDRYPQWWPWLRDFDGVALATGETWRCTVQPPLPYAVRFELHLVEVEELGRIQAEITGEIVGDATIELRDAEHAGGTDVHLRSSLAPGRRWLQVLSSVARPVVRYGHDWVLDTGARQFAPLRVSP